MSTINQENIAIEDRLHAKGYKTERTGDIVVVYDPVHKIVGNNLVLDHYKLEHIRTMQDAWKFIDARS